MGISPGLLPTAMLATAILLSTCQARGAWSPLRFYGVYNAPLSPSLTAGLELERSIETSAAQNRASLFPFIAPAEMETLNPEEPGTFGSIADLEDQLRASLRLNSNRQAIQRTGVTCGVPGSGKVDPFELGPKFFAPPETSRSIRRRKLLLKKQRMQDMNMTRQAVEGRSLEDQRTPLPSSLRSAVSPLWLSRPRRGANLDKGELAKQNELCWQVKIVVDLGNGTMKICGGIIVGSKTILTAAHCVMDKNNERPFHVPTVTVQVGDESLDGGQRGCSEIFPVDLIVPHPSYDIILQNNDIALLMLAKEIDFERKPCACKLCIKDKEPRAGSVCLVAGYGQTLRDNGGEEKASLKWFKQRVLRQAFDSKCAFHVKSSENTDLANFICAGDVDTDSSCQGDEGGAFVCFDESSDSHYAAGIISFSGGCGKHIGSQYTKVRNYLDWIENNISWRTVALQRGWNREIAREKW